MTKILIPTIVTRTFQKRIFMFNFKLERAFSEIWTFRFREIFNSDIDKCIFLNFVAHRELNNLLISKIYFIHFCIFCFIQLVVNVSEISI